MTEFETYLKDKGLTVAAFAELVGVSQPYISEIKSGKKRPNIDLAWRISEVTEGAVPMTTWLRDVTVSRKTVCPNCGQRTPTKEG